MRFFSSLFLATALIALGAGSAVAKTESRQCRADSGTHRIALIELYTSEGCSSCPPADTWLGRLPQHGLGSDKAVPLAFHVDYWDYIGWADRFAKPLHTQRQRQLARRNRLRTIYTPQVVINGQDFRHWYWGDHAASHIEKTNHEPARARITLVLHNLSRLQLQAHGRFGVLPQSHPTHAVAYLALYQNNLSSTVTRGENSGRQLQHSYVVRELQGPFPISANGMLEVDRTINLNPSWNHSDMGVAAFVQDRHSGEVLQALARPLCN
jgi:hypothetical protein